MASPRLPRVRLSARLDDPVTFGIHTLEQSIDLRVVLIDRKILIRLTPIEHSIFSFLLARPRMLVFAQELGEQAFQVHGEHQDRQMLQSIERHINALRRKLRHSGLSIRRVVSSGWLLADEEAAEPESIQQTMI